LKRLSLLCRGEEAECHIASTGKRNKKRWREPACNWGRRKGTAHSSGEGGEGERGGFPKKKKEGGRGKRSSFLQGKRKREKRKETHSRKPAQRERREKEGGEESHFFLAYKGKRKKKKKGGGESPAIDFVVGGGGKGGEKESEKEGGKGKVSLFPRKLSLRQLEERTYLKKGERFPSSPRGRKGDYLETVGKGNESKGRNFLSVKEEKGGGRTLVR